METKKEITNEDLARIIANRFDEVDEKINAGFQELRLDVANLKTDVARIDATVNNIEANLNKKVDKIDHHTLDYRVEKLEEKFA